MCIRDSIRFPFDLRGKKYIDPGAGLTTGVGCRLEAYSNGPCVLRFGQNVQLNDHVHICAMREIEIGNHVLMASKIYICLLYTSMSFATYPMAGLYRIG